jgi:hypothetical protein
MKGWNYAVRLYRPRSRGNAHELGPLLAVGTAKYKVIATFWGSFDLGVTRFSGRKAPLFTPSGLERGLLAKGQGVDYQAFYSYALPAPKRLDFLRKWSVHACC